MAIAIKIGPPGFTPQRDYADRATAKIKDVAEKSLKGASDFTLVALDQPGYRVDITLDEILLTDKSITCNFKGAVSDPGGLAFGFNLTGHSATTPSKDEAGDVLFITSDAVPKMMTVRVLPAIRDAIAKNSGGGAPKQGAAPAKPPPGKPAGGRK